MTVLLRSGRDYERDDANRADSDNLATSSGGLWRLDVNAPGARVLTNRIEFKNMTSSAGRAGNWHSAPGLYTDSYEVRAQLMAPTSSLATDNCTGIILAGPDTFGSAMMPYFLVSTGSGSAIMTQNGSPPASGISSNQSGQTVRSGGGGNVAQTSLIAFRRTMTGLTTSFFEAFVNGSFVLGWNDSSGLIPTGPANRRFGFIVEGNRTVFPATQYRSPAIDWIEARDLW